jgi:hypothetical protein
MTGVLLLSASGAVIAAPIVLPGLGVDNDETSVSGLSSGAFMAVQFSVAYSADIKGAGVVAGGPYYCAQGNVGIATSRCSCTGIPFFSTCEVAIGATDVPRLVGITERLAAEGKVDPVSGLSAQRIWMFAGGRDSEVPPAVMDDLNDYYRRYVPAAQIHFVKDPRAEHTFPTEDFGNDCGQLGSPYLGKCGIDAAGELLNWIYGGNLNPRSDRQSGRLIQFDQNEFTESGNAAAVGLANTGYVYVPAACDHQPGARCRLHVAFHGCRQNVAAVGEDFVRHAGYNPWADTNGIVVLYPQTRARFATNPNACWDWFDSSRSDPDYANKNGRQMGAIRAMMGRLAGRRTPSGLGCFTASNADHVRAGRAFDRFFFAFAAGSGKLLGLDNDFTFTTLKQTAPRFYLPGNCP